MVVVTDDGAELPLASLADAPRARKLDTVEVTGDGAPVTELALPYRGRRLVGSDLGRPARRVGPARGDRAVRCRRRARRRGPS